MTLAITSPRRTRMRIALFALIALPIVVACDGIDAASKATQRAAYRASFQQVPMITSRGEPGRVLNMHVFQGPSGQMPRASQTIPFHAQLSP